MGQGSQGSFKMIWILLIFVVLVVLVITNRIASKTIVGKALLAFDYFVSVLWSRDFDITISSQCGPVLAPRQSAGLLVTAP